MRRVPVHLQACWASIRRHPGAVLATLACLGGVLIAGTFVTDDALITLRYARHFALGHGVRWNPGRDPVEGYTNFSHVLFGAAALKLGLPALWTLKLINLAALLALPALCYALMWRTLEDTVWASVAALLVALHPPLWYWSASGLETGLYTFGVYWAVLQASSQSRRGRALCVAPLLLVALTRFEGPVVALALALGTLTADVVWPPRQRLRDAVVWIVPFAIVYAAYFAWRLDYFGHLMPNSAYYKGEPSRSQVGQLFWEFVAQNAFVLGLAVLPPWRRLGETGLSLFALVMAYVLGFYSVRPSISYMHRFYLPVFPAVVMLAASGLWWLSARGGLTVARAAALALALWALVADQFHHDNGALATYEGVRQMNSRILTRTRTARFVRANFSADAKVAAGDVGVIGYLLPQLLFDTYGLNDEAFVHRFQRDRRRYVQDFFARERPEALIVVSRMEDKFRRRYGIDDVLVQSIAGDAYRLVHRELSPVEAYHYFVYARRDVTLRGARLGPETASVFEAAGAVEAAAQPLR